MDVSIIILNFNTFQLTSNCIESIILLTKGVSYEIILVDNYSSECSPDLFKIKFPSINLVKSIENGGFAKGNNLGIKIAKGEFILLLNSDTFLVEDAISKTVFYYKQNQLNGIISCKLEYPNGKNQSFARRFKSIKGELLDIFRFFLYLMPYKTRSKIMLGSYFKGDYDTICDWLGGAFFMFPKYVMNNFSDCKLDERFFMYGEDQLWCWQFLQLGYKSFFYSKTKVVHIHGGSATRLKQKVFEKKMIELEIELYRIRNYNKKINLFIFSFLYTFKVNVRIFINSLIKKN